MASMAVQASSNFPSSHPIKYDVFLSFRGADTRTNFTDHLYKALQVHQGIPTFRDSEELEKGNDLSQLFEAIEKSTIAVVILSSNYASSTWCLKEVAKIVECRNKSGLIVLPVFYDIEPTQVRYQTEIFKNYFDEHEKRYKDSINSWRQALTEVADLSGWHLKDRLQTTVIQEIVECVDRILKLKFNPVFSIEDSKDFVGLDRVREIELDLDIIRGSVKVGVIGICGMPGVGKTTIAKVVSRRNWHHFDASSFIANVGEILKKNGLLHVQNQLYHDLLDSKVITMNDVPAERRKLRHKKVLIVLDGVTEFESIGELIGRGGEELMNWFGPGSIIMITTIDEKLLKRFKAKIHKVERLIVNEARLLFFRKAFNKDQPPHKFANLSNKFVDFADGLPLAIVALGNLLFERTLDEWEAELRTLEANNYTGDENLVGILKVCIDGLRGGVKEIFLDIACFFKGDDKKRAERIFESCGHNPSVNLNILLEKSLVTIVGGKLWMHDLLQDIGQKMVVGESKSLGKRSRLWRHEDAISVLMKYEGTRDVRGIFLSSPQSDEVRLKADSFSNMDFLRLLKIKNVIFSECHEYDLSNRLSLLDWHGFPSTSLPSKFKPEKLVELHLPQSQIKQLWKDIMMPPLKMLVIMDLSDCKYLTSTPHFQSVPNLESLILKGCTRLSEVYLPIGNHLQKLMLLNLEGCESLSSLPNGICILRSLTTLILSGCSKLANLPEKFGENMKQLSELDLNGTAIKELPASIKHLAGLIRLNLRDCKNLLSLLAMICSLTKLQVLNLSGCSNLDELPENLGSLVGLKELDASRSCIKQVPSSILLLKDLESLSFRGCGGLQLPASFSGLDSLTKLDLSYCKLSDGEIPADLDCLSSIDHLNLSGNSLVRVPESITKLSKLEVLLLNDCSRLRSLPHLPSSIQRVFARNCPLLGTYSNKLTVWTSTATGFCFINSQSSEERKLQRIPMTEQRLLRPHLQKFYEDIIYKGNGFEYITPHNKIPSWLDRRSEGSSITISLPPDYFDGKRELMGFALCFVYESQGHENMKSTASNFLTDEQVKYSCNYSCRMFTCGGPDDDDDCPLLVCKLMDHDYVGSFRHWVYVAGGLFADRLNKRSVRAQVVIDRPGVEVQACGASLIYSGGVTEFVWNLNLRDEIPSHMRNLLSPNDEAQMNRSISLYTRGKKFLDHDAGSSSRTGSSTQVPNQRLTRPESNDQSNEQEQGTNSQLTHVAKGGCASDTRLLIEIEPHTSRDDSITSTEMVGDQLGANVESFLDELFELGGKARSYVIGFIFSLRAILPWFTHQSIGNKFIVSEKRIGSAVVLPLPPELYNNKKWVGFALSVSFTLPPCVWHEKSCCLETFLYTSGTNLHYLRFSFDGEDNLKGSHRILVIHIPRGHFEKQLNWGSISVAEFGSSTPGVEVEMCGMRVVYEQDLKGLTQTITQCTIRNPLAVYNGHACSFVPDGNMASVTAFLNVNLIEAAESSERRRSTLQEPLRDSKFISDQQINLTIEAGTLYTPLKNKDSVVEWKRNLQLLLECFFSFSDLSIDLFLHNSRTSFSKEFSGIFLQKEIPDWFPQLHSESMVLQLPPNLENDVNFMGLVLCAAFSVNASEADVLKYLDSGHCAQLNFRFHYSIFDQSFDLIRAPEIFTSPKNEFMWLYRRGFIWQQYVPRGILKDVLHKDTSVKVSCRTDSISSKVLGVQKCSFRIVYKQDVEKLKQTIIQCFTSFVDNEDIIRAYLVAQDAGYNYGTTCSSDERESYGITPICQRETSGESNGPDLIPFFNPVCQGETSGTGKKFPQVDLENRLLDQGQLLDFDRFSIYNCCVPPNEIIEWFGHNSHGPSVEIPLPPNSTDWIGLALCAYFEVLGSSTSNLDSLNTENSHHLTCYFETETDRGSPAPLHAYRTSKEEFQWLHLGGFLWLSYIPRTWFLDYHQLNKCYNLKATIASDGQGLGVLKCGLRLLYHNDEQEFKETIMHCVETGSSGGNSIIEKTRSERLGIPIKSKGSSDVSEDERDSYGTTVVCQGETSGKSNDLNLIPFFIEIEPPASTDSSSTQIEQLRRNIESLLEQLFQGYNTRHYNYGFILSPRVGAVMPWFSHQSFGKVILITAPPDLYKDKKWVGFALYVAFTQSPDPDLFCVCSLHCSPGNRVISIIRLCPDQFSGSQRRLCFIHIPRARLPKQCNDSSILAAFDFCPPVAAVVEMCGIRVVYDEDVKGLVQTITQSTIRNQPVYFSRDDQTLVTPDGDIAAVINMATSLVAHSKGSVQPTPNTFSPPAVPSQKFGKVELQMHTWFHQKVTIEWKRNLKLLLQSFFRLDHLSIKLHLGQDAIACYEDLFAASYLFPRKEIPDWFTQKSLTSTVVTQLPDDLQSDNNWMGFVVCAAFSVHPHPTDVGNYKDSQLTSDVSCNFRWSSDSSRFFSFRGNLVRVLPNTKFMWLSCRGFIWLRFVPYDMFKIAMMDESHRQLEASFESGSPALAVQKCSLRILYKKDVEEYKQTLIQCFVSVFDNLYHSQPYTEDDFRHNKEPIHEDDQIDSFGTASLSPDTQHETNTAVPVPHGETSGNSFNRFNSILFEPILYDNRSAVIFADFRGWEEFKPLVESQPEHVLHGRPQSLGEAWMERVVQFLTNFCRWKVCW